MSILNKRKPFLAFTSAFSLSPSKQLMLLFKNFSRIVSKTRKIWIVFSMKSSPFNNRCGLDIFLIDSILIVKKLNIKKKYSRLKCQPVFNEKTRAVKILEVWICFDLIGLPVIHVALHVAVPSKFAFTDQLVKYEVTYY